jgi:hypothetical protein
MSTCVEYKQGDHTYFFLWEFIGVFQQNRGERKDQDKRNERK